MNKAEAIEPEGGWVRARANCYPEHIFKQIEIGAQDDIDVINSEHNLDEAAKFMLQPNSSGNFFTVYRTVNRVTREVKFYITRDGMRIVKDDGEEIKVTLTLNNYGQCRLKVNGEELEQWQVRRLALEGLFFLGGWDL
ncbi:MAG: hypothetical protein ABSH01_19040 [Terriglobia bacterium]|jgi:hypothetical protein